MKIEHPDDFHPPITESVRTRMIAFSLLLNMCSVAALRGRGEQRTSWSPRLHQEGREGQHVWAASPWSAQAFEEESFLNTRGMEFTVKYVAP